MKKIIISLLIVVMLLSFVSCTFKPQTDIDDETIDSDIVESDVSVTEDFVDEETDEIENEISDITPVEPENMVVTLYFPDSDALYLHSEEREITVAKKTDKHVVNVIIAILEELFKGPTTEGLAPSLVGEDLINGVDVSDDGTCILDFKSDFEFLNSGGSARENFVFGSIVNSVCMVDGVERVKFNIDGDENAEFGSQFSLKEPVLPQWDLVK